MLLLDEPSLGLAPRIVAQVMDLIRRLRDESGLTVLLVEQNARSALAIADRGVVLNVGKVVAAEDAAVLAADVGAAQALPRVLGAGRPTMQEFLRVHPRRRSASAWSTPRSRCRWC